MFLDVPIEESSDAYVNKFTYTKQQQHLITTSINSFVITTIQSLSMHSSNDVIETPGTTNYNQPLITKPESIHACIIIIIF